MAQHNELGKKGEEIAADYLSGIGYKILDRNWRHQNDEIDIIAMDGEFVVIVEVKTRSTAFFGQPSEAVDYKKEKFLIRASEAYLIKKDLYNEIRFDIVSVIVKGNEQRVRHIKEAFYPEMERGFD